MKIECSSIECRFASVQDFITKTIQNTNVEVLFPVGGLVVSVRVSGSSSLGLSPDRGLFVAFSGKTLYSHSASLKPGV